MYAQQQLALAAVGVRVFHVVADVRVCATFVFCLDFGKNFNIMNALSDNQSPTLPQKIDSRGGLFWCKNGLVVHAGKMNFYLN